MILEPNYRVYRVFPTLEEALELASILKENGVDAHVVKDEREAFEKVYMGSAADMGVSVEIPEEDLAKAEYILSDSAFSQPQEVESPYLKEFSDDELKEILGKPDEWSTIDYKLALDILHERGISFSEEALAELKRLREIELSKPIPVVKWVIAVGYILALAGGILGMAIGLYIWRSKRSLPNGERVLAHDYKNRLHGRIMFFTGAVALLIIAATRMF